MKTLILLLFLAVPAFGQSNAEGQSAISNRQLEIGSDTVLVSRSAVESSIETLKKVNEQERAGVEELKKQIASPALTSKERLQMQVQIETAIENIMQRGAVIWTLQSVLQDTTLQILSTKR
ncbi:MAG: hypothetical protein L0Y80_00995 [Ignavibacteriae bacterium]|nr:hypothetical protein [Ignavibacteriota bacterium]